LNDLQEMNVKVFWLLRISLFSRTVAALKGQLKPQMKKMDPPLVLVCWK
jgi:hypothetical protein